MSDTLARPETPLMAREDYEETLRRLSEASVHRHFDAFADIDWNSPDFAVRDDDPRWVLPSTVDPIGAHPWYQAQPLERQIAIGQWRQANVLKVGLQFENALIRAIMQYVFTLPNGSPEYRYLTHEATEECHHTQMFQEAVNRIGVDVPGMPWVLRKATAFIPMIVNAAPTAFFIGILGGEEPIDHTQKNILRAGEQLPPMLSRVMEIHIAEEARHISFAHEAVKVRGPKMGPVARFFTALFFPLVMRMLCDAIMVPPRRFRKEFGIPRKVMKDIFWRLPESRERLANLFADVRMLAEQSNLMTPTSRLVWRLCKIDGPASRYRSEPAAHFARAA